MSDENKRKLRTPAFRMSFPNILEPRVADDGKKRYELSMLFPPGTDMAPLKAALKQAMLDKHGDDTKKWPKLKRGADDVIRDFAEYNTSSNKPLAGDWTGWMMVRANAQETKPPGVVGPVRGSDGKFPVLRDAREVYGGRWARATIEGFFYDRKDGKGVTFGLLNVQLLKHDTPFGAAQEKPEDAFDDMPEEAASGGSDDEWN